MILEVFQERSGVIGDVEGLFEKIFDHNAGHLALFGYGDCGNNV